MEKGVCDPLLAISNHLSHDFYVNKTTVGGKGAARGHFISGENIDAAPPIQSLSIGAKPSARVQAGHSRHDAVCDFSNREKLASTIEHSDLVVILDAPGAGVSGVEPNPVVGQRFQTRDDVEKGIDPGFRMGTHELDGVLTCEGVLRTVPGFDIPGDGWDQRTIHLGELLAVDLDLARWGREGVMLRVLNLFSKGDPRPVELDLVKALAFEGLVLWKIRRGVHEFLEPLLVPT